MREGLPHSRLRGRIALRGIRFQIASFATVWQSGRFRLCCSAKTASRQFPLLKHSFSGRASLRLENRRCLFPGRKHLNELCHRFQAVSLPPWFFLLSIPQVKAALDKKGTLFGVGKRRREWLVGHSIVSSSSLPSILLRSRGKHSSRKLPLP